MSPEDFERLLERRDDIEREHTTACAILEEEGPDPGGVQYDRCARLHAEMTLVEEQIDAALEAERVDLERAEAAGNQPPAA